MYLIRIKYKNEKRKNVQCPLINMFRSLICQVGSYNGLFSLSNEFYLVDYTWPRTSRARFTRYCEYTTVGSVLVSRLRRCCIRLMILVCVCTWKLHAEDDPVVESQAAVLCGNARRHLALSILLPTLRPRPLQLSSTPVVRSLSFPIFSPRKSSFFSAFPSLYARSTPRNASLPLLFRRIFCPR